MRTKEVEYGDGIIQVIKQIHQVDIDGKGLQGILEVEGLIDELQLSKIHGQLLVDEDGNGLLIMGEAGTGKSRLTSKLLRRNSRYKFISDDFLLIKVSDGKLYGTHHPLKDSLHSSIIYNPNPDDLYSEKEREIVPQNRRFSDPVRIKRVYFLGVSGNNLKTHSNQSFDDLNTVLANNLSILSETTQPLVSDKSITFTRYEIPDREARTVAKLANKI